LEGNDKMPGMAHELHGSRHKALLLFDAPQLFHRTERIPHLITLMK